MASHNAIENKEVNRDQAARRAVKMAQKFRNREEEVWDRFTEILCSGTGACDTSKLTDEYLYVAGRREAKKSGNNTIISFCESTGQSIIRTSELRGVQPHNREIGKHLTRSQIKRMMHELVHMDQEDKHFLMVSIIPQPGEANPPSWASAAKLLGLTKDEYRAKFKRIVKGLLKRVLSK